MKIILFISALVLTCPTHLYAYIGPGAGFAFIGSSFVFVITILLALVTILAWPFIALARQLKKKGLKPKAKRVIVVGLDGMDAKLTEQMLNDGKLPNLKRLSEEGAYRRLGTTLPALSPVAWSTFQTGVNPGAHNIFDFLSRDKRLYIPTLTSTETIAGKVVKFLGVKLWTKNAKVVITRKSKPFWKILAGHGIFSNILRVPISYPPEKFSGTILSAMCTPDVRGTQGSFSYFSTRPKENSKVTSGEVFELKPASKKTASNIKRSFEASFLGPQVSSDKPALTVSFQIEETLDNQYWIKFQDKKVNLKLDTFTNWIKIEFSAGFRKKISSIARFSLREVGEHISFYMTPLNVDPEKPILPIAHPIYFASWLARKIGLFSTLGFAEDTWGRNEKAINDKLFLEQAYLTHAEREKMFFETLQRTNEGVLACVFDATDRIQHMYWRYLESDHPAPVEDREIFGNTISELYQKMDVLVGKVKSNLNSDDILIVLSDHGFGSFRRGINLNTWLKNEGYLVLKEGTDGSKDYLMDVDWTKTKAYCLGLTGIYLNRKGRELKGVVEDKDVEILLNEISEKLKTIKDPKDNNSAIRNVYQAQKVYRGVYSKEAPDLILGYYPGYRVSWDSVTGTLEPEIFSDNIKAWSGDHHIDPELVPGILFINKKINKDNPNLLDLAPTILDIFGVKVPKYMEGKSLI
jgi:predicted AlkP superfamily phosphohydrolase/phosphomutase